ncbi:MAG: lipid A-modifier LpxR family protein [Paracoccaceae bacterium]
MMRQVGARAAWLNGIMLALCLATAPGHAEERVTLGWGRMFTNDGLGDAHDRWRTGAYTVSRVRGPSWSGQAPARFGEILEFRAHGEVIAPESLTVQPPGDRRYAGVLSFGVHTHMQSGPWETSLGLDLALTGKQTGMSDLQRELHDLLGYPRPLVASTQIPNGFYPTLIGEVGRSFDLGPTATVRPFAEAQIGLEDFVRAGVDLSIGSYGAGALMLRDGATGQHYRGIAGDQVPGLTFTLGADVAHVFDSALLPDGGAAVLSDTRPRVRVGMAWQGESVSASYGVTWLGKEFDGQREDQLVGSLSLRLNF